MELINLDTINFILSKKDNNLADLKALVNGFLDRKINNLQRNNNSNYDERFNLIKYIVFGYYNVSCELIDEKIRKREIVVPRQICHYFAKLFYPKKNLFSIGQMYGGKNHGTVLHSIKTIKNDIKNNPKFANEIEEIKTILLKIL